MAGTAGDDSRHTLVLYAVLAAVCVLGLVSMFMGILEDRPPVALVGTIVAATMVALGILLARSERD